MDERVIAALAALVAYILWRRGIVQGAWNALFGGASQRNTTGSGATAMVAQLIASSTAAGATPPVSNTDPTPTVGSGDATDAAVLAAVPKGLAATVQQYGSDLWNWCLAFVNKTRQQAGLPIGPYGANTAHDACAQLVLRPGIAPPGATVCFSGAPGHIGIAQGGDSYVSAGLIHGGLSTGTYVNNPNYMGFSL